MSNLLAAVGRGQLSVLDDRVAARRANFAFYQNALGDLPGITFMPEPDGFFSTRWLTCLTIDPAKFGATREDVQHALEAENIEARPLWKPMRMQPVFRCFSRAVFRSPSHSEAPTHRPTELPRRGRVSEYLFEFGLCLPSGSNLTDEDKERVVEVVRRCWK